MPFLKRLLDLRRPRAEDSVKPFLDHLEDLRWTLLKMAVTLGAAMAASFLFRRQLVAFIQRPLEAAAPELAANLKTFGVVDSMTISFNLAFYAGIVLSFPFLLFFAAEFVLPALTARERRLLLPSVAGGFALFIAGVAFCYTWVLPQTLRFFHQDALSLDWTPTWTVRDYFGFVTYFTLAFGLAFELPLLVLALVALRVLNFGLLNRTRPYAVVAILVLAAVITPTPDALTLLALGLPMLLLYESCIWLAWLIERARIRPSPPTAGGGPAPSPR